MNNGIQFLKAALAKRNFGQARAIKPAIGVDDLWPEVADNFFVNRLAGFHEGAAQRVGLSDLRAQFAQHGRNGAFAAAQAAGKSDS
jgi:hypothetical protein